MAAFSKKHYYDVMKSGQEDTILESDTDEEPVDQSPRSTSDVGCSIRARMKSYAIQTQWSRGGKNFRHEYTNTSEVNSEAGTGTSPHSGVFAIHRSLSCEDIPVTRTRSSQTEPVNWHHGEPQLIRQANDVMVGLMGFHLEKRGLVESDSDFSGVRLARKPTEPCLCRRSYCIQTVCSKCNKSQEAIYEPQYVSIPNNRGLSACSDFTLGTCESRRCFNENCHTKLIGGCRVPVCQSYNCYKSRF